jgi:hypothetical protein
MNIYPFPCTARDISVTNVDQLDLDLVFNKSVKETIFTVSQHKVISRFITTEILY